LHNPDFRNSYINNEVRCHAANACNVMHGWLWRPTGFCSLPDTCS
jgi:hypothetical protein